MCFQPVTTTEVQKASRISPLAMSLVKPPDPETMKGLSVKEQRELTALHAEMTLSGQASSSSNPALSIADNAGANEEVNRHEGIRMFCRLFSKKECLKFAAITAIIRLKSWEFIC